MRRLHLAAVISALLLNSVHMRALVFANLTQEPAPPSPAATDPFQSPEVYALDTTGLISPRILKDVKPNYTGAAMRARIQGVVRLECIVELDGTVGAIRVVKSLDSATGLDDEAVKSVKQWRFVPGTKDGTPVRTLIRVELSFTLGRPTDAILSWPAAFAIKAGERLAAGDNWVNDVASTADLTMKFAYPPGWILSKGNHPARLILLQKTRAPDGRACSVSRPKPSTVGFTAPLSGPALLGVATRIRQTAAADPDAEVHGIGQIQIQGRLWIWTELSRRTIDLSRLPTETAAEIREAFDGIRSWEFATTEGSQGITVSCYVLKPRGTPEADLQGELRPDAADFAAILNRISIAAR